MMSCDLVRSSLVSMKSNWPADAGMSSTMGSAHIEEVGPSAASGVVPRSPARRSTGRGRRTRRACWVPADRCPDHLCPSYGGHSTDPVSLSPVYRRPDLPVVAGSLQENGAVGAAGLARPHVGAQRALFVVRVRSMGSLDSLFAIRTVRHLALCLCSVHVEVYYVCMNV